MRRKKISARDDRSEQQWVHKRLLGSQSERSFRLRLFRGGRQVGNKLYLFRDGPSGQKIYHRKDRKTHPNHRFRGKYNLRSRYWNPHSNRSANDQRIYCRNNTVGFWTKIGRHRSFFASICRLGTKSADQPVAIPDSGRNISCVERDGGQSKCGPFNGPESKYKSSIEPVSGVIDRVRLGQFESYKSIDRSRRWYLSQ